MAKEIELSARFDSFQQQRPRGWAYIAALTAGVIALTGACGGESNDQGGTDADSAAQNAEIDLEVGLADVAVGEGAIWVCSEHEGAGFVSRIDPTTNEVVATIDLGSPTEIAAGEGGVWATDFQSGTLTHIDPESNDVVASISIDGANGVATGFGRVWVLLNHGGVATVDPTTDEVGEVVEEIAVPAALSLSDDAVWVTDLIDTSGSADTELVRIDPESLEITDRLRLDDVDNQATDETGIWATNGDGEADVAVFQVDPDTGDVRASVEVPGSGAIRSEEGDQPGEIVFGLPTDDERDVALGLGFVWVTHLGNEGTGEQEDGSLSQIDPDTSEVVRTFTDVGHATGIAVGEGSAWVTSTEGKLFRRTP